MPCRIWRRVKDILETHIEHAIMDNCTDPNGYLFCNEFTIDGTGTIYKRLESTCCLERVRTEFDQPFEEDRCGLQECIDKVDMAVITTLIRADDAPTIAMSWGGGLFVHVAFALGQEAAPLPVVTAYINCLPEQYVDWLTENGCALPTAMPAPEAPPSEPEPEPAAEPAATQPEPARKRARASSPCLSE